jgi:hypothetical protein
MTNNILMYDNVTVSLLPGGAAAYGAYVYGTYNNYNAVKKAHPSAEILGITPTVRVNNGGINRCLDVEPGDATPSEAPAWIIASKAVGLARPVIYCSASAVASVVSYCSAAGLSRYHDYLIWSAHYTGAHICGPGACGYPSADGTQWTDKALGLSLDASWLEPGFFTYINGSPQPVPPLPTGTPTLKQGDQGPAVVTLQERLIAWGFLATGQADGAFGGKTASAVITFQKFSKLTPDGIVGPKTWAVLDSTPPPVIKPTHRYSAPSGVRVSPGYHSFHATWTAPPKLDGIPVPDYSLSVIDLATMHVVNTYPRLTGSTEYQGGALVPGHSYRLEVAAGTGAQASQVTKIPFKTGTPH